MSAVEEIKEALETAMHIHGSKAMQHAEELDALRAKVAELERERDALRQAHDRSHAEVLRLAEELRRLGWKDAAPMHINAAIDAAKEGK